MLVNDRRNQRLGKSLEKISCKWQFNRLSSEREKSESEAMAETEGENGAVDEILGLVAWKTRVQGKMRVQ